MYPPKSNSPAEVERATPTASSNVIGMIWGRKSIAGSLISGLKEMQEMLDFCGAHNITADIERIPMRDINAAHERMLKSDVKYRFVIEMGSIK